MFVANEGVGGGLWVHLGARVVALVVVGTLRRAGLWHEWGGCRAQVLRSIHAVSGVVILVEPQ